MSTKASRSNAPADGCTGDNGEDKFANASVGQVGANMNKADHSIQGTDTAVHLSITATRETKFRKQNRDLISSTALADNEMYTGPFLLPTPKLQDCAVTTGIVPAAEQADDTKSAAVMKRDTVFPATRRCNLVPTQANNNNVVMTYLMSSDKDNSTPMVDIIMIDTMQTKAAADDDEHVTKNDKANEEVLHLPPPPEPPD